MHAAIRLRGSVNTNAGVQSTFTMLRLRNVNSCVLLDEVPSVKGMLKKVEGWVTWGEVSEEMEKELKKRKGPPYHLSPPSGGLKSIKRHYPKGDMGYRGKDINALLRRML